MRGLTSIRVLLGIGAPVAALAMAGIGLGSVGLLLWVFTWGILATIRPSGRAEVRSHRGLA